MSRFKFGSILPAIVLFAALLMTWLHSDGISGQRDWRHTRLVFLTSVYCPLSPICAILRDIVESGDCTVKTTSSPSSPSYGKQLSSSML
jgi:hypothetical protein